MAHTIELHKVSKYYANEETVSMGFSRLDLNLDIGEFVAITGESGSGKSTLLNVISGLDTYEEGEMYVCGEDTTAYGTQDYERYRKTYIGNIFQDFNLINSYSVYQNIEAVMLLSGKKKSECREKIMELIDKVGLTEYTKTKASRLSGGQKQRVAIARALAKDAPIIVADEPTGNLDSESANGVMETLSKVSKDKLVVIVTHNYDQAEPYVTRKLTMHDGRIIEDKIFTDNYNNSLEEKHETENSDEPIFGKMRRTSEIRLGLRNTFNLPAKFLLLFIVYLFVATAVLSQYASSTNSLHQGELLGYNQYFTDSNSSRIVVKKSDETVMTDEDISKIEGTHNIDYIIENDMTLDSPLNFNIEDMYFTGSLYPVKSLDKSEIMYGSEPQNDYEIVIRTDPYSDAYYYMSEDPESYLGKKVTVQDSGMMETYNFDKPLTICGIIVDDEAQDTNGMNYGNSKVYASDRISRDVMVSLFAAATRIKLDFNGTIINSDYQKSIYESDNIPEGKAYILEDATYYYKDNKAVGKKVKIQAENRFFSESGEYEVDKILTAKNFHKLTGLPNSDYDMYYNVIFISKKDYEKLFDRGFYQVSAYMIHEEDSDATLKALQDEGFTTLAMKDSLTDITGGFDAVLQLFASARLVIEFIILFYIAYAVIRLIMKSRNSYYSILRILGATKRNTDNILRVELIIMMMIAYAVDLGIVASVKLGLLRVKYLENILYFLKVSDYVILGLMLLAMSLLIANRYSRKIFTKSAMKTFRGEVA